MNATMGQTARLWATRVGYLIMFMGLGSGCDVQNAGTPTDRQPSSIVQPTTPAKPPTSSPPWVVDPTEPGLDRPPVGRSLFDFLMTKNVNGKKVYDIPFPLQALIARIESQLHDSTASPSTLKRLLIPVNRSLQRRAGEGEYFVYPRAVFAVDTDADASRSLTGMHLKDRLYIGYHEKTAVLEIISYNEAAGRFEFQIVNDYQAGGTPIVRYANRALCTACHQNQSPIFSRPLWDETNANRKIAALLTHQHRRYYGFPIQQGVGTLQAFDDATDRANDISLAQLLWREGCELADRPKESIHCRAELLEEILHYGLSQKPTWNRTQPHASPSFLETWRTHWPQGLALPNPDIPNRNPFRYVAVSEFPGLSEVEATALEGREPQSRLRGPYEPTQPREPLELWTIPETPQTLERVLAAFAQFFTKADLARLERLIHRQPDQLHHALNAVTQESVMDRTDALSNRPFRRVAILAALDAQLGASPITRCCLDDRDMPPLIDEMAASHHVTEAADASSLIGDHKMFDQYCGACHHGTESFPPNFLHGSTEQVEANLAQCADRIFVRLSMWNFASTDQREAPMPPAMHLMHHRISQDQWNDHPDLQALRQYAVTAIKQNQGATFAPEALLQKEYDTLPACLAPHANHLAATQALQDRPGRADEVGIDR